MHPIEVLFPISRRATFHGSSGKLDIAVTQCTFVAWHGPTLAGFPKSLRIKHLVKSGSTPAFAEIAVLEILRASGWQAVWLDAHHRRVWSSMSQYTHFRSGMEFQGMSHAATQQFWRIFSANQVKLAGAWDIFAAKETRIAFLELKEVGPDRLRLSQMKWFETALREGTNVDSFRLIEWSRR